MLLLLLSLFFTFIYFGFFFEFCLFLFPYLFIYLFTIFLFFTFNGGRPFTVVEDGQLAHDFARRHGAETVAFSRHFHLALCKSNKKKKAPKINFSQFFFPENWSDIFFFVLPTIKIKKNLFPQNVGKLRHIKIKSLGRKQTEEKTIGERSKLHARTHTRH